MRVLIATGGSGGHIIPALVTARELKNRGHDIFFAGVIQKSQAGFKLKAEGFECFEVGARGFVSRSPSAFLNFLVSSVKAFFESMEVLSKVRPDVVAGFGGYGSFWVVLAGVFQGLPTMIQEQNVKPGKANKVLSFFVKKIAVGFDAAKRCMPANKTIVTGCPLRPMRNNFDKRMLYEHFGLPPDVPVILVLGGSQGSRTINEKMVQTVAALKDRIKFSVIHICGDQDVDKCRIAYDNAGVRHCVFGFTDEIEQVYAVADFAVSRAGAMTVTELAAFGLPVIFIPYPYAGGHQRDNAMVLTRTKMSMIIDEKDLTQDLLNEAVLNMLQGRRSKEEVIQAYQGIYRPEAAVILADEVERLKR